VPRLRRCLVFLEAIDALTRAAIACRVFDAKHIRFSLGFEKETSYTRGSSVGKKDE
jgi:hypothetical protein